MPLDSQAVLDALADLRDPSAPARLGAFVESSRARALVDNGNVKLFLETGANEDTRAVIEADARRLLQEKLSAAGLREVTVSFRQQTGTREISSEDPLPGVRNVLLVMAGKGGVGKSTVASNLALALGRSGHRVGLLDADIYGPSMPTMFGINARPTSSDGKIIDPIERFGIKLMSIGFLLEDPKQAVVWRGPMLHGALQQFLKDVGWGKLDYLIIDLPPGTGDVALTLSQKVRATGTVIVTTPQEVALVDVYKAVSMCEKLNIPILGVVENESYFVCDGCSKRHEIFGQGGGRKISELTSAPLLGQIPLEMAVRIWGDQGIPVVQAAPTSASAQAFVEVAEGVVAQVAKANSARVGTLSITREGAPARLPIVR